MTDPVPASQPVPQRGKRALGLDEDGQTVATTKKKQQAPRPNKNGLIPMYLAY
jgi:hypothetical protein